MQIVMKTGTLDINENMDGWVINSEHATVKGNEDLPLKRGDRITINGDVYRGREFIGNVS